jgi:uncharacterized protein YdaU (DUF1376 family)
VGKEVARLKEKYSSPSFQWYPDRFRGSGAVQAMTLEEEGAYRRLLDSQWSRGYVPSDPRRIAAILGVTPRKARELFAAMAECFEEESPGRLVTPFLESVRQYAAKQSRNGNKGGRPQKTQTVTQTVTQTKAKRKPRRKPPNSQLQTPKKNLKRGEDTPVDKNFGEFGHARLNPDEERKLRDKLGVNLFDRYVNRYDRWVDQLPPAKRKQRKTYNSILNWYDSDIQDGKLQVANGGTPGWRHFDEFGYGVADCHVDPATGERWTCLETVAGNCELPEQSAKNENS